TVGWRKTQKRLEQCVQLTLESILLGNHQTITSELIQSSLDSTHLPSIFTDCPPRISLELIEDASCCKITSLQQSVRQLKCHHMVEKYKSLPNSKEFNMISNSDLEKRSGLMKLSVAHLTAILRAHDVLEDGSKDELIARIGLLKAGVLWTEKDLEGTNWDPGWYYGEVQRYDENDDQVFVFYLKDLAVHSLNVAEAFADGITRPPENL
ncbi:unnamed protein product, partial [Porites evermanni]